MINTTLNTKWGTARLYGNYYMITNGINYGKKLHRLIWESFYGFKIPKGYVIHHKNENPLDNCILNLQLVSESEHMHIHKFGKKLSEETKLKLSQSLKGRFVSDETKQKISKNHKGMEGKCHSHKTKLKISQLKNTSGIYRVTKFKDKTSKTGIKYLYQYYENGKRKSMGSVNLNKLKGKVLAKGLDWIEFDKEELTQ